VKDTVNPFENVPSFVENGEAVADAVQRSAMPVQRQHFTLWEAAR
jgi:hypothetical protein